MNSHARLLKLGLSHDPVIATQLLKSYTTHSPPHSLSSACRLFDDVPAASRDAILWTTLISAYSRSHRPAHALRLFSQMLLHPPLPNAFTLASAARAAAAAAAASSPLLGRSLHAQTFTRGLHSNVVVSSSIIDMYSKCGDLNSARKVFDGMSQRNSVSWNSMIAGYAAASMGVSALEIFYRMRSSESDVGCDEFSVASSLTACAKLGDPRSGEQIHGYAVTAGFEQELAVGGALANMYFRCGGVECAERAMEGREPNSTTKIMMIKGYLFNRRFEDVLRSISSSCVSVEMIRTDCSVSVSILTACANLQLLRIGRQIHGLILTIGSDENCDSPIADNVVLESALIDMYCKCSDIKEAQCVFDSLPERNISHWNTIISGLIHNHLLEDARRFFDCMPCKNVISWTAMMSGYVQHGLPQEGLRLMAMMYGDGESVRGNCLTFATVLDACSSLTSLELGKQIHGQALKATIEAVVDNMIVESALVDMYSKSGNLSYARKVFDRMRDRNVVSWTSMITGYAAHGLGLEVIDLLEEMISMGIKPNEITFIAVLTACSHCGLVEQGIYCFRLMRDKFGIVPRGDHYTCMVDMLVRAGMLVEASNLVQEIRKGRENSHTATNLIDGEVAAIEGALLGGCRLHGNVEIGSKVAKDMLKGNHQVSDTFVALSNVYAAAEMWDKVYNVRREWRKQCIVQEPGYSQIHV